MAAGNHSQSCSWEASCTQLCAVPTIPTSARLPQLARAGRVTASHQCCTHVTYVTRWGVLGH
jgi:hypothetical protein